MELKSKEIASRLKCQRDVVTNTVILPELVEFDIDHFQKKFHRQSVVIAPDHVVAAAVADPDHVNDAPVQEEATWEVVGAMNDLTELDTV